MVVFPLKCTCIPYLPHVCFIHLAIPFVYGMTICPTVALVSLSVNGWIATLVVVVCISIVVVTCVVVGG